MNTKQDYLNLIQINDTQPLQNLINNRFIWRDVEIVLQKQEDTDIIRFIENEDGSFTKQEYVEDPNAELFSLDFTLQEAQELIGG